MSLLFKYKRFGEGRIGHYPVSGDKHGAWADMSGFCVKTLF